MPLKAFVDDKSASCILWLVIAVHRIALISRNIDVYSYTHTSNKLTLHYEIL